LYLGDFSSAATVIDLSDYDISLDRDIIAVKPASLKDGEVWTGKSVVHNLDGTLSVTLYAWGKTYWACKECMDDNKGCKIGSVAAGHALVERPPLAAVDTSSTLAETLTEGNPYVHITDRFNQFRLVSGSDGGALIVSDAPSPATGEQGYWKVHQSEITGPAPAELTYILELDDSNILFFDPINDEWLTDYWYSSGVGDVRFTPCFLDPEYYPYANPFYYTKGETTYDSFTMSMNWNNGNGLNSGTITDKIFAETITFGSNKSPEFQGAYPGSHPFGNSPKSNTLAGAGNWALNVNRPRINRGVYPYMPTNYYWHLEWEKANTIKSYWFTVRDMDRARKAGIVGNGCSYYATNRVNMCPVAHLWHETNNPGGCFVLIDIVYQVDFPNPGGNNSQPAGRERAGDDWFQRNFEEGHQDKLFSWDGDTLIAPLPVKGAILLNNSHWDISTGTLRIEKQLEGWYDTSGWNVDEYSEFTAVIRVKRVSDPMGVFPYFLRLSSIADPVPGHPTQYAYNGITDDAALATQVKFYPYHPAIITGLRDGMIVAVEEFFGSDTLDLIDIIYTYEATTTSELLAIDIDGISGATQTVTVTNDYSHGIGKLEIHKLFGGFPGDWGVNDSTNFHIRVWDNDAVNEDSTVGNYLLFQSTPGTDGSYRCVGNAAWGLSEAYPNPITIIPITEHHPLTLSNLWSWGRYRVEEVYWSPAVPHEPVVRRIISDTRYDDWANIHADWKNVPTAVSEDSLYHVLYSANNGTRDLGFNETIVVSATNTFKRSTESISIFKELAGSSVDWGVTDNTVFRATVQKYVNDAPAHTLVFDSVPAANGSYRAVGHIRHAGCGAAGQCAIIPLPVLSNRIITNTSLGTGIEVHFAEVPASGLSGAQIITEIPFSVNKPALLSGMWAGPAHTYYIREVQVPTAAYHGSFYTSYTLNHGDSVTSSTTGIVVPTVYGDSHIVTIENDFVHEPGNLAIYKEIDPASTYDDLWGVIDNDTMFSARVRVGTTTPAQYMTVDGDNRYTGTNTTGTEFLFSVNNPILIMGIPALETMTVSVIEDFTGRPYVNEVTYTVSDPEDCGVEFVILPGECLNLTVTNLFTRRNISLTLEKALAGAHAAWPIPTATDFQAKIRVGSSTPAQYLTVNGSNEYTGYNATGTTFTFSADTSVTITGIPASLQITVEEIVPPGSRFTPSYVYEYASADEVTARVINTYLPPPTYEVKYNPNFPATGGTGTVPPTESHREDAIVPVKDNPGDLRINNWIFLGWSRNPGATVPDTGFWLDDGGSFTMPDEDVDLYAVWVPRPLVRDVSKTANNRNYDPGEDVIYTISFRLPDAAIIRICEYIEVVDTLITAGSLTFDSVDSIKIDDVYILSPETLVTENIPNRVSIRLLPEHYYEEGVFNHGGKTVEIALKFNVSSTTSSIIRNKAEVYVKPFGGDVGTPEGDDAEITVDTGSYVVIYDPNWPHGRRGTGDAPEDDETYDQSGTETATVEDKGTMEKSGYKFVRWNTLKDGSGTDFDPGEQITMTGNIILYAVWELDVPITKTPSQPGYNPGNTIDYAISFTLPGDMSGFESIRIEDVFNITELTFVSVKSIEIIGGGFIPSPGTLVTGPTPTGTPNMSEVSVTLLPAHFGAHGGKTVVITLAFTVAAGADAPIENDANLYFTPEGGSETPTHDVPATAEIKPHNPDIPDDLNKSAIPGSFSKIGDTIGYTIRFTLPADISGYEGLLIYDELPAGLTYVNGSGRINIPGIVVSGTSGRLGAYINKSALTANAGREIVLTFSVRINSNWNGTGDITNTAELYVQRIPGVSPNPRPSPGNPIPDIPNRTDEEIITPIDQPNSFTKIATAGSSFAGVNSIVTFSIRVELPADVSGYEGLLIYDHLPNTLDYISGSVAGGTVSHSSGRVSALIGKSAVTANAGGAITLTITARVNTNWSSGNIINKAELYVQLIPGVPPNPDTDTPEDDSTVTIIHDPTATTTTPGGGGYIPPPLTFPPAPETTGLSPGTATATVTPSGGISTSYPATATFVILTTPIPETPPPETPAPPTDTTTPPATDTVPPDTQTPAPPSETPAETTTSVFTLPYILTPPIPLDSGVDEQTLEPHDSGVEERTLEPPDNSTPVSTSPPDNNPKTGAGASFIPHLSMGLFAGILTFISGRRKKHTQ
jgi:fimbrial isopeptide formation D2 family protein